MRRIKDFFLGEEGWLTHPVRFRKVNGWMTVVWAAMLPLAVAMGLIYVIAYVSIISIYANFAAHLSTWAASRAEELVFKDDSAQRNDVRKMIEQLDRIEKKLDG